MDKNTVFFSRLTQLFPDEPAVLNRYDLFSDLLRQHLVDMGYEKAVKSHDFAKEFHKGRRKDGTPEFLHQQSQALYTLAFACAGLLPDEMVEPLLCANFKHDTLEESRERANPLTRMDIEQKTTPLGAYHSELLSKIDHRGMEKPNYHRDLVLDPVALIAKEQDRGHNQATRIGGYFNKASGFYIPSRVSAFSNEKISTYNDSTKKRYPELTAKGRLLYPNLLEALSELEKIITYECDVIDTWQRGGPFPQAPELKAFNLLPGGINPVKVLMNRIEHTPYSYVPKIDQPLSLKQN